MSVAGLKKQFYKASQVRKEDILLEEGGAHSGTLYLNYLLFLYTSHQIRKVGHLLPVRFVKKELSNLQIVNSATC